MRNWFLKAADSSRMFRNAVSTNSSLTSINVKKSGGGEYNNLTNMMPYKIFENQTVVTMNLTGTPVILGYSPFITSNDVVEIT
jgi:hypothetical protein